jgi:hypothetical protein
MIGRTHEPRSRYRAKSASKTAPQKTTRTATTPVRCRQPAARLESGNYPLRRRRGALHRFSLEDPRGTSSCTPC